MSPFDLGSGPAQKRRALPMAPAGALEASAPAVRAEPRMARISITDRCDYACTYCRPSRTDGYAERRLAPREWETLIDGLVAGGIRRFRITGGEPLVHPGVVDIVRIIASRAPDDVALTTNASQLDRLAAPLKQAGLRRINVSLDTLQANRFRAITRGGELDDVLRGIDAALAAGLAPIKLNTVVLRGVNDDEIESITQFGWARGLVPRFLEVMGIAEGAKLVGEHLVPVTEMRQRIAHLLEPGAAEREPDRGPAKYLRARHDPALRVGFISGTSDTYCEGCDRLRVSSDGDLRPCLARDEGVAAGDAARAGDVARVPALLAQAWRDKPDGKVWKGCTEATASRVSMRAIGG